MRKLLNVSLVLLAVTCPASVANAQLICSNSPNIPGEATLIYDPADGMLSINGGGTALTTVELKSPNGLFRPDGAINGVFVPPWDSITSNKLFVLKVDGDGPGPSPEGDLVFGTVLPVGMSFDQLFAEFAGDVTSGPDANTVAGSFLGGGAMNPDGHTNLWCIPEPSSSVLFCLGALCLWHRVRRRSGHIR